MTITFHLLDAMDEIPAQLRDDVMGELEAANQQIARFVQMDRLDVVVAAEAWVIREWGLSGRANGPGRITITLDPGSPQLNDLERPDRMLATLAHEMHHVARLRSGIETYTLGGRFVSEGLAQCFEEEVGAPTPFYALALDNETLKRMATRARPLPLSDRIRSRQLDVRPKGRSRMATLRGILPGVQVCEGVARQERIVRHRRCRRPGHRDHGRLVVRSGACLRRVRLGATRSRRPPPSSRSKPSGSYDLRSSRSARRLQKWCRRLACRSLARVACRRAIRPRSARRWPG